MQTKPTTADAMKLLMEGQMTFARMENAGIRVDTAYLDKAIAWTGRKIEEMRLELEQDEIFQRMRKKFKDKADLNKPAQLGDILYREMKLPYPHAEKTKTDRWKVTDEGLAKHDLPFLQKRDRWRKLKTVKDTFLVGLKRETVDGFVHPSYNLNTVTTYRSSVNSPNLTNQPGRDEQQGKLVRRCYVPREGCAFLEFDFGCLVGNTEIETIAGKRRITEIVEDVRRGKDVYVYGYRHEERRIGVAKVVAGKRTDRNRKVLKVTLDNGESVLATPDHRFLLRGGAYRELKDLTVGDSLMPFCKKTQRTERTSYTKVYLNDGFAGYAHRMIALDVLGEKIEGSGKLVHHRDGDGTNNSLENLEVMDRRQHMRVHIKDSWKRKSKKRTAWTRSQKNKEQLGWQGKTWWKGKTEEQMQEWRNKIKENHRKMGRMKGAGNVMFGKKHSPAARKKMSAAARRRNCLIRKGLLPARVSWSKGLTKFTHAGLMKASLKRKGKPSWNKGKKLPPLSIKHRRQISLRQLGKKHSVEWKKNIGLGIKKFWKNKPDETCGLCGRSFRKVTYKHTEFKHKISLKEYRRTYNHKIVSIEPAGRQDVYDIEVQGIHNFALACGIVVHNSHEFVIAADVYQDPAMMDYARDKDIHKDLAAEMFLCGKDQVFKGLRHLGKNGFVFPKLYGSYHVRIAEHVWNDCEKQKVGDVPAREWLRTKGIRDQRDFENHVKRVEQRFERRFPVFVKEKDKRWDRYLKTGSFDMVTGFRVEGVCSRNFVANAVVQGPAFHCLLKSMILLDRWLRKNKMKSLIVNEVHDSALVDCDKEEQDDVVERMNKIMTKELPRLWPWLVVPPKCEPEWAFPSWWNKKKLEDA